MKHGGGLSGCLAIKTSLVGQNIQSVAVSV
jgi:hypothetical protein